MKINTEVQGQIKCDWSFLHDEWYLCIEYLGIKTSYDVLNDKDSSLVSSVILLPFFKNIDRPQGLSNIKNIINMQAGGVL